MSKILIAIISFIVGNATGIFLLSCLVIAKESDERKGDKNERNNKKNTTKI